MEPKAAMTGLALAGPGRPVQLTCTETRPVRARFTPARPGFLRGPGPAEKPRPARVVSAPHPMDLGITSAHLNYEELITVQAMSQPERRGG